MPDLSGRTAVVTGANSGLGRVDRVGARAARGERDRSRRATPHKGEEAAAQIRADVPGAELRVEELDLADLDSVRAFAERLEEERARPADQQRRRDGAAAAPDQGRLREPVRHQPPRPLRAHRPAAAAAARRAGAAGRDAVERRAPHRADPLRRPPGRAAVHRVARVRAVEARQPDVRARAPAPGDRGRHRPEEHGRASGLRGDQPPVRGAAAAGPDGDGGHQPR